MEVRIYKNGNDFSSRKATLVVRLSDSAILTFSYESCVRTFKSLYGNECVIEFIVF